MRPETADVGSARVGQARGRRRIGLIVPSTNTVAEADLQAAFHGIASIHGARLWLEEGRLDAQALTAMNSRVDDAARDLASAGVDIVAYASTAGGFFAGPGYDETMTTRLTHRTGIRTIAVSGALTDAVRAVGARRVAVASPYNAWENERLRTYLEAAGIEVVSIQGDPVGSRLDGRGHNDLSPESAFEFSVSVATADADALVCACTAWRTMEVAEAIEDRIGRPVVTSNQALAWAIARALGVPSIPGYGRLLSAIAPS